MNIYIDVLVSGFSTVEGYQYSEFRSYSLATWA